MPIDIENLFAGGWSDKMINSRFSSCYNILNKVEYFFCLF